MGGGLGRKDAEAAAMDGLSQKEMFVQEGRDERPARPLPHQRTREPRVPT
jgi:hypothetical protein